MELNPIEAWRQYRERKLERIFKQFASLLLGTEREQPPYSLAQLAKTLSGVSSEMKKNSKGLGLRTDWLINTASSGLAVDEKFDYAVGLSANRVDLVSDTHGILFARTMVTNRKTNTETCTTRFGYYWDVSLPEETRITFFSPDRGSDEITIAPSSDNYVEAVAIIMIAHERLLGVDSRLTSDSSE